MATLPPHRVAPIATHEYSALSLARPLNACNDRRRIEARSGFAKIRHSTAEREYAGGNKNGNHHHLSRMQGIRLHGKPPWERLTIVLVKARFSNRPSNEHFWLSPRGRACDKERKLPPDLARERDSLRGNKKFKSRKHYGCGLHVTHEIFRRLKCSACGASRQERSAFATMVASIMRGRSVATLFETPLHNTRQRCWPCIALAVHMAAWQSVCLAAAGPIRYLRLHASLQCNFDGRE